MNDTVRGGAKAILDAAGVLPEHRTEQMWSLAERDATAVIESLDVEHAALWDESRKAPGAFDRRVTPWMRATDREDGSRDSAGLQPNTTYHARVNGGPSFTVKTIGQNEGAS